MKKHISLWLLLVALALPWVAEAQSPGASLVLIGDTTTMGASGSFYIPYQAMNSGCTQQLVLASEMNGEAIITGIDFYCYQPTSTGRANCTIYLANTFASDLFYNMVPYGATFQAVAVTSLACTAGWNHYAFDTPFHYFGSGNLVVAVDAPWGRGGSSFNTDYVQGRARYSDFPIASITQNTSSTATTYRNIMRLHTQPATPVATCPAPVVWVDSLGSDAVRLRWRPGYQDTSWTVECVADGDTAWRSSGLLWGDTAYTMTGLSPNTHYFFRLTAFCTDTFTTVMKHVLTNCTHSPLPYSENFEGSWQVPSCWNTIAGAAGTMPGINSSYSHSATRSVRLQGGAVVLPAFNTSPDSLELYFWAKSNGGSIRNLYVGMVTDPLDLSTFYPLDTVAVPRSADWVSASVRTSRYPRSSGRLAIVTADPLNTWLYIDDIDVSHIVPCEALAPATVDWKLDTAALVRWTDTVGAVYYDVAYGPTGFVPDSTTIVTDVRTDSLRLTGLLPYTQYDVYVRPECGSFTTHWSPVMTFRTLCSLMDTLPLVEDFETYAVGTHPTVIPCWQGTVSLNTLVANLPGDAHSGSKVMRFEWSIYEAVVDQKIVLPTINTAVLPINTLQLSFWAKNVENTYNRYDPARVLVGVMDDPAVDTTFQLVDTIDIVGEEWSRYDVPLSSYRGMGRNIVILSCPSIGSHNNWYAYIDDLLIELVPPCPSVTGMALTGLTATSVTVGWDAADSGTMWQVFIDSSATATPLAGTTVLTSPTCTFTDLVSETPYYIWVRTICPKGDTSGWEGPMQVVPGVWNMRANKNDTLTLCGVSLYDNGGSTDVFTTQTSQLVILPDMPGHLVSISGLCDIGGSSTLTIYEGVGTSGSVLWNKTINNNYAVNFGPVISETGALTLYFDGWTPFSLYNDGFELQVSCVPDTCIIHHLQLDPAVPASDSTIALTWQCNGSSHYEVEYGPVGFAPGSGTIVSTATNHYTIGGLTSLARREVRVRSICGTYDTGAWVSGIFNTQPCNDAVYRENFDSTLGIGTHPGIPIGFNGSEYSLAQTLVDSAFLAGLEGGITALAFHPIDNVVGDHHSRVTVYLANVPDTAFAGGPIMPDAGHRFVKVIDSANLNHLGTSEWQPIPFDHPFMWDGRQNLLVTVLDEDGAAGMRTEYASHFRFDDLQNRVNRSYVIYSDWPINIDSLANTTTNMSYGDWSTGDLRLYTNTCHLPLCATPVIDSITGDYENVTVYWSGESNDYQLSITPGYAQLLPVSGNSYTFSGLQPATTYQITLRQNCTADSLGYSDGVTVEYTTDSYLCAAPDTLYVFDITHNTATFDWPSAGNDSLWQLEVWMHGERNRSYAVTERPYTVEGLTPGAEHFARVRGYCGSEGQIAGEWSNEERFTTTACPAVRGLDTVGVTATSVSLVWDADTMAQDYLLQYGPAGFEPVEGADSMVSGNSCVVVGLNPATTYDFYLRTRCADDWVAGEYASLLNVATRQPVGINNTEHSTYNFQFSITPNPAKGVATLYIEGLPKEYRGAVEVTVSDLTGRKVLSRSIGCDGNCRLVLDVSDLAQGAYFIRIAAGQHSVVRKLIVK
jgi:hypothetical protein